MKYSEQFSEDLHLPVEKLDFGEIKPQITFDPANCGFSHQVPCSAAALRSCPPSCRNVPHPGAPAAGAARGAAPHSPPDAAPIMPRGAQPTRDDGLIMAHRIWVIDAMEAEQPAQ